jgi:arabinofuranosyltransferase
MVDLPGQNQARRTKRELMNLSKTRQKPTPWHIALAAAVALALVARFVPGERTIDDAFITFRYARNLLQGHGFVYNPGERVQGTTTPLYTLLMAGEKLILPGVGFPTLAIVTNALADAASIVVIALLCKRTLEAPWLGIGCGFLWAVLPMSVTFCIGGMETSVYILLLLLTLVCYARGQAMWAVLFCALATLTRPDALLVAVPLFAHMLWDRRGIPWREGLFYILLLIPWVAFATLHFGSPLANSVVAKTAAYRLAAFSALIRLIQHYATPFFEHEVFGMAWVGVGAIGYLTLSLVGGLAMFRREGKLLPLAVYPWLYLFAFSVSNPLIFRWYMAPILPTYILCILYGGRKIGLDIANALSKRWPAALLAWRIVGALLLAAAFCMLLNGWTLRPDHGPDRPAPEMAWFKLEQLYRKATLDLKANEPLTPPTRIAAGDIGVIGFESGTRILDTLGLVSPQSTPYYPLPDGEYAFTYAVSTDLILDEQPDYVIVLEIYVRNTLNQSVAFGEQYELYRKWPTDIYDSDSLLVYRRRTQD